MVKIFEIQYFKEEEESTTCLNQTLVISQFRVTPKIVLFYGVFVLSTKYQPTLIFPTSFPTHKTGRLQTVYMQKVFLEMWLILKHLNENNIISNIWSQIIHVLTFILVKWLYSWTYSTAFHYMGTSRRYLKNFWRLSHLRKWLCRCEQHIFWL